MMEDERNKVVMEKMKESILFRMAATNPASSSTINSPHVSSFIDNRLQQVFKSFDTPTHPPYHSMITRAMKELNEKSGLTEKAISEFIKREYNEELPFAHATILHVHLKRLCNKGKLKCIENEKYVLVNCDDTEIEGPNNNGLGKLAGLKMDKSKKKFNSRSF